MAKKTPKKVLTTRNAPPIKATAPLAEAAEAASVPSITVPPGGTLEVVVEVGPMVIPYTVAYAGRTVIKALVDRAEPVPLKSGSAVLAYAFAHAVKGWSHSIGVSVNGGAVQLLEKKSEANKDPDHSVGFALVSA
jgi:hypothetical protein